MRVAYYTQFEQYNIHHNRVIYNNKLAIDNELISITFAIRSISRTTKYMSQTINRAVDLPQWRWTWLWNIIIII